MATTSGAQRQRRAVYKIIVIGDSGVGKSCLSYRFCNGTFLAGSVVTIGADFRERTVSVDGEDMQLQIWDTAGQERFHTMVKQYFRNARGVVLVYDVTSRSSFQGLTHWMDECKANNLTPDVVPYILVGNKCDIENKVVKSKEALQLAERHGMSLLETSARDESECDNVETIFLTLARKMKNSGTTRAPDVIYLKQDSSNNKKADDSWGCSC